MAPIKINDDEKPLPRADDSLTFDAGDHASGRDVSPPSARNDDGIAIRLVTPYEIHTDPHPTRRDGETQTWWLSFCDSARPDGDQFLGVAIVDVTSADAAAIAGQVTAHMMGHGTVPTLDAVWLAAATRKAHQVGCNPGGEVAAIRIDEAPEYPTKGASLPRNTLLTKAELAKRGCL